MKMSKKIRKLRIQHKLSQRKLAELIGTEQAVVSRWENGVSEPSLMNGILLAEVFNISLDELCCRDFKGGK